jgi:hypothetical protein
VPEEEEETFELKTRGKYGRIDDNRGSLPLDKKPKNRCKDLF